MSVQERERVACAGCGGAVPPNKGRGRLRKWCSERCRKASYGDPCVDCGVRTTCGAEVKRVPEPRCEACVRRRRADLRVRRALGIVELRALGLPSREIGDRLGCAVSTVLREVWRLRAMGVSVAEATRGAPLSGRGKLDRSGGDLRNALEERGLLEPLRGGQTGAGEIDVEYLVPAISERRRGT